MTSVNTLTCPKYTNARSCGKQQNVYIDYSVVGPGVVSRMQSSVTRDTGRYQVGQKLSNVYYHPTFVGQMELRD